MTHLLKGMHLSLFLNPLMGIALLYWIGFKFKTDMQKEQILG